MIFFTSDTHYGHNNVIRYCRRPFDNIAHMEEELIHRWNRVVTPDDTVYHLGDFFFCKPPSAIDIINKLNGSIKLVRGNHDSRQTIIKLYELPHSKFEVLERYTELNYERRKFVLCHYPIESWNNMTHGSIHLHGHSHGTSRSVTNRFDVGVDAEGMDYTPQPIQWFLDHAMDNQSRPDRIQRDCQQEDN